MGDCHISSEASSRTEEYISSELQDLRNRALKLSEDLKSLSLETESIKAAASSGDIGPDGQSLDKQSEEIKAIMKRYSDIIGWYSILTVLCSQELTRSSQELCTNTGLN